MEEEKGKVMILGESAGKQDEKSLHSERASITRILLAVVTCVRTPAQFWARIGEGKAKEKLCT